MYLKLERIIYEPKQTIGTLTVHDNQNRILAKFDTLELPWKNNQRRISCIPNNIYRIKPKFSFRFGNCFEILNVLGRDCILIHSGNFHYQTKGCILIGHGYRQLDSDNILDLCNSKTAMNQLKSLLKSETTIEIFYDEL